MRAHHCQATGELVFTWHVLICCLFISITQLLESATRYVGVIRTYSSICQKTESLLSFLRSIFFYLQIFTLVKHTTLREVEIFLKA